MRLTKNSLPVALLFVLFAYSCNKTEQPDNRAVAATLHDYTSLDGCSWVFKLQDNHVLEPVNLDDFQIDLQEDKKVWLTYHPAPNLASICMVGTIVEIEAIWDR